MSASETDGQNLTEGANGGEGAGHLVEDEFYGEFRATGGPRSLSSQEMS